MSAAKRGPEVPGNQPGRSRFGGFRGALGSGDGGGNERFGRWTEGIARGMGTPWFLVILTLFCLAWLVWNTTMPEVWRFDSAALGFTALTLILSLQASYAAPMILLAQNRQDDRDRVQIEQDRQRAERNLADTEFLAREVVALRLAIGELPDRDDLRNELRNELRQELRALLAELQDERRTAEAPEAASGTASEPEAHARHSLDDSDANPDGPDASR